MVCLAELISVKNILFRSMLVSYNHEKYEVAPTILAFEVFESLVTKCMCIPYSRPFTNFFSINL